MLSAVVWAATSAMAEETAVGKLDFSALKSPIIMEGDANTAYRDPAAVYHDGWFRVFFTFVKIEPDKQIFSYCAWSKSRDLIHWSEPKTFTPRDQNLNFGSPGNIIRYGNEWVLCLQTYPRPNGERCGNADARPWIMRSQDLENWSAPELLHVKGPDVPREKMGRIIDPYLLEDKDEPGKWWCFYKGVPGVSWSRDLTTWTPFGKLPSCENPCVIVDQGEYVFFRAQNKPDGIGVMRTTDFKTWRDEGELTLGQEQWPWANRRLTAGFVLDLRKEPSVGKALMFFHGEGAPGGFDNYANLGIAWSVDLKTWEWPATAGESMGFARVSRPVVVGRKSDAEPLRKIPISYEGAFNAQIAVTHALCGKADALVPVEILKKIDGSHDVIDEDKGTVTVNYSGKLFEFKVGRLSALVSGQEIPLEMAPRKIDGVLHIPIALLAKEFEIKMEIGECLLLGVPSIVSNPNLAWQGDLYVNGKPLDYTVQIAREPGFREIVREDTVAITGQYVPAEPLDPGEYWWRVKPMTDGDMLRGWQPAKWFKVIAPRKELIIKKGATAEEIQKVIEQAAANSPAVVRFEKGDYRVAPSYGYLKLKPAPDSNEYLGGTNPPSLIELIGVKNLIIDGCGSTVFIQNESAILKALVSKSIILKNITFTTPFPLKPTGRVTQFDRAAKTFQFRLLDGHATPEEKPAYFPIKKGGLAIRDETGAVKRDNMHRVPFCKGPVKIAERLYEVGFLGNPKVEKDKNFAWQISRIDKDLAPGDYVTFVPKQGGALGLFGEFCEDMTLYNVRKTDAGTYGYMFFYCEKLKFLKFVDKPRSLHDLTESGMIGSGRIGIWMEGTEHWNTSDDGPQNSTLHIYVLSQLAANQLLVEPWHHGRLRGKFELPEMNFELASHWRTGDIRPGDQVTLSNKSPGPETSCTVTAVTAEKIGIVVTLDRSVSLGGSGRMLRPREMVLANRSGVQTGVAYRKCLFKNIARNGIYGLASNYLIENCRFEDIGAAGLRVGDFMAARCRNIYLRNNIIRNVNLGPVTADAVSVGLLRAGDQTWENGPGDVYFLNNRIIDRNKCGIGVWAVKGMLIEGNVFQNEMYQDYGLYDYFGNPNKTVGNGILGLSNCRDVIFRDNTISDTRPMPNAYEIGAGVEGFGTTNNIFANSGADQKPRAGEQNRD